MIGTNFIVELNENERELIKNFEKKSLFRAKFVSIYQSLKYIKIIILMSILNGVYNGKHYFYWYNL